MKKLLCSVLVALVSMVGLVAVMPTPVANAAPCAITGQPIDDFLSFPPWYRGLDCVTDANGNQTIEISGGSPADIIFKVALNIIDIVLRLIGIAAVGFIIWGGFQYIISRGEPERTKSAIITIRNAIIGMVIAMVAAVIVSFVVGRLSA